jgi:hypothetical protein
MGMHGRMLLNRTVVSMTLNKWLRRVCKQDFLLIRAQYSQEFLGGILVLVLEAVVYEKRQLLCGKH